MLKFNRCDLNIFVMESIIEFFQDQPWFGVVAAAVALASAITAITPTPPKGSTLAKLYHIIEVLALNIGKAKQTGKDK